METGINLDGNVVSGRRAGNKALIVFIIVLLLLLGGLVLLYQLLSAPPKPAQGGPAKGITAVFSLYGISKKDLFDKPYRVTAGGGRLYVADTRKQRVVAFTLSGRYLFNFGAKADAAGNKAGRLLLPIGLAVGPDGRIYVASFGEGSLKIFDAQGNFQKKVTILDPRPTNVEIVDNTLYIQTQGKIIVADLEGKERTTWGSEGRGFGQFRYANGLASDGKKVFISDSNNARLQVLDMRGKPVGYLGAPPKNIQNEGGLFGLGLGMTLDDANRLFITDAFHQAIRIFSTDGDDIAELGAQGSDEGQFYYPTDIESLGGTRFAVADQYNDRVQVLEINAAAAPVQDKDKGSDSRVSSLAAVIGGLLLILLLILVYYGLRRRNARRRPRGPGLGGLKSSS